MLGFRKLRCKTNEILLVLFVIWSFVFLVFWQWKKEEDHPVTRNCLGCTNIPNNVVPYYTKRSSDLIPVYIVEEHHEVLPYWFNSAERGLIPMQDNVLFHIDGHVDGAPPPMFDIIPLFKFPKSFTEIRTMMQQNDVFIAGAVQAGLISRFIWVWPPWETNITAIGNDHVQVTFEIGLKLGLPKGDPFPICICVYSDMMDNVCLHMSETFRESEMVDYEITRNECDIKKTLRFEAVSENKALELSRSDNWLSPLDNIILDIDEDYYGCEAAVIPLYDAGIKQRTIEKLQYVIGKLFCPSTTAQENQFDNLFYDLLNHIKIVSMGIERRALNELDQNNLLFNETRHITEAFNNNLVKSNMKNYLCTHRYIEKTILVLVKLLLKFNTEQLTAIATVGLCLSMSTSTYGFSPKDGMRLCNGYNRPNQTMVVFHTPDVKEIDIRTANMKTILKNVPAPSVVTVCRSIRDGYTPIKYFNRIEKDVLQTLKQSYNIKFDSIYYDSDLLGARAGLPSRHVT